MAFRRVDTTMRFFSPSFLHRIFSPHRKIFRKIPFVLGFIAMGTLTLGLLACGERTIGYALILWPPKDTELKPGTLVPVISESNIHETYTLSPRSDKEDRIKVSKPRVRFFSKEQEADEYVKEHEQWLSTFGTAEKNGLPIRQEPDVLSRRVYRLKQGQTVKVLSRIGGPVKVGGLEGHWYRVYTEDGVEGYLFGSELSLFEYGDRPKQDDVSEGMQSDPYLRSLNKETWRPASFKRMIDEDSIDLQEMDPKCGLFFNADNKIIRIVYKGINREFTFTSIDTLGPRFYAFLGSSLRIRFHSEQELTAFFSADEGEPDRELTFTIIDRDIAEVIEDERQRRYRVWQKFLERGPVFSSDAYGTIIFQKNRRFTWENYYPLVPSVIPYEAKNRGSINFSKFLSQNLKEEAQGVISFYFDTEPGAYPVHFLYTFQSGGIQLVHVPEEHIENNTVMEQTQYPLVIFFSSSSDVEEEKGD